MRGEGEGLLAKGCVGNVYDDVVHPCAGASGWDQTWYMRWVKLWRRHIHALAPVAGTSWRQWLGSDPDDVVHALGQVAGTSGCVCSPDCKGLSRAGRRFSSLYPSGVESR